MKQNMTRSESGRTDPSPLFHGGKWPGITVMRGLQLKRLFMLQGSKTMRGWNQKRVGDYGGRS